MPEARRTTAAVAVGAPRPLLPAVAREPASRSPAGRSNRANTLRHVVVTFTNTSSTQCALVGYPDANLVTAAGGVLVHVDRQPALASHLLHLNPGDTATATVESSALDVNGSGNPCPREGTLVVTAPGDSVAHTLPVALPICHATISNVD